MAKEYTQYEIDTMYVNILTGKTLTQDIYDDCQRIKALVKEKRNIILSTPGSHKFWTIASGWINIDWLDFLPGEEGDVEILKCWDKLVNDWYNHEKI